MNFFEYSTPFSRELKELKYDLPVNVNENHIIVAKQLLNSRINEINHLIIDDFKDWHYRDCMKYAIRLYAYYLNNPQQFNHDPKIIVPAMIVGINACALTFLKQFYNQQFDSYYKKVNKPLIKMYGDRLLHTCYNESSTLALKVKEYRDLLEQEDYDLGKQIATIKFYKL